MAKPRAHYSLCRNPPPSSKDELAGAAATEGSSIFTPTLAMSRAPIPVPTIALSSDNKLFKQFIKVYLKTQVPGQIEINSKPCKLSFKARFPDLYYGNLHIDCYQFCQ